MTEDRGEQRTERAFPLLGSFLPYLPSLTLRLGGSLLRLKRDAKKGGKTFHKELVRHGIDEHTADELTEIYLQPSSIKQYMSMFR